MRAFILKLNRWRKLVQKPSAEVIQHGADTSEAQITECDARQQKQPLVGSVRHSWVLLESEFQRLKQQNDKPAVSPFSARKLENSQLYLRDSELRI